jgi:hypothetical protein
LYIKVRTLFILLLSSVYFIGCSDTPGPVGYSLLDPSDVLSLNELSSDSLTQSSTSVLASVTTGGSSQVLLGKFQETESSVLVRFDFSTMEDTIKTMVNNDSLQVKQAIVKMYAIYYLGDMNLPFDYSVHKINSSWTSSGFTLDSLAGLNYDAEDVSSNKNIGYDTVYSFDLGNDVMLEWLRHDADTSNAQFANNGIYLEPTAGTQRIVGFQAISSSTVDTIMIIKVVYQKLGSGIDDTLSFVETSDIHIVKGSLIPANSENIFIQGGVAENAKLKFDLPDISPFSIVNSADLTLTYDSTKSYLGSPTPTYLTARFLTDSALIQYDSSNIAILTKSNYQYTGSISGFVQRWINGEKNYGILISFYNEVNIADILTLYSSTTVEKSKRPFLKIKYSTKK